MPIARSVPALLLLLAVSAASAAEARAQDVLVVTSDDLRPALDAWTRHRRAQGHEVAVAAPGEDVAATVRGVHAASRGALRHVLVLGDTDRVPCAYAPAVAIAAWESDTRIATDAPFCDVDGDGRPDVALGRIPAHDADEARRLLARSIAYETSPPPGTWRRRLDVVAGVGGFGAQADMALEMVTRLALNRDVPPWVETGFVYAKETSAFCPPPARLQPEFLERLARGALVVAYVGHGSARHVDRMTWQGRAHPILEADAAAQLACARGAPVLVFVACSTGRYDAEEDCLAELAYRRPAGPACVVASSRVSTPYGNGILAVELLDALLVQERGTIGDAVLAAKRALVAAESERPTRVALEALAAQFYETDAAKRATDRAEHVQLYQLFGDPLLRPARPAAARLEAPSECAAGTPLRVLVRSPVAGRALLEVLPRRDANARLRRPGRDAEQLAADFAAANVRPLATGEADVATADEAVALSVDLPAGLDAGRYDVRVFVEGPEGCSAAGVALRVTAR